MLHPVWGTASCLGRISRVTATPGREHATESAEWTLLVRGRHWGRNDGKIRLEPLALEDASRLGHSRPGGPLKETVKSPYSSSGAGLASDLGQVALDDFRDVPFLAPSSTTRRQHHGQQPQRWRVRYSRWTNRPLFRAVRALWKPVGGCQAILSVIAQATTTTVADGFDSGVTDAVNTTWGMFRIILLLAFCYGLYKTWRKDDGGGVFLDMFKLVALAAVALWLTSAGGINFLVEVFNIGTEEVAENVDDEWALWQDEGDILVPATVDLRPHLDSPSAFAAFVARSKELADDHLRHRTGWTDTTEGDSAVDDPAARSRRMEEAEARLLQRLEEMSTPEGDTVATTPA